MQWPIQFVLWIARATVEHTLGIAAAHQLASWWETLPTASKDVITSVAAIAAYLLLAAAFLSVGILGRNFWNRLIGRNRDKGLVETTADSKNTTLLATGKAVNITESSVTARDIVTGTKIEKVENYFGGQSKSGNPRPDSVPPPTIVLDYDEKECLVKSAYTTTDGVIVRRYEGWFLGLRVRNPNRGTIVRQCSPHLTAMSRRDGFGQWIPIAMPGSIALPWANSKDFVKDIQSGPSYRFDLVWTSSETNRLGFHWNVVWPGPLATIFNAPGHFKFFVSVSGDAVQEDLEICLSWTGKWNELQVYRAPNS